ncbi:MAG: transcriptional regulator [Ramlibacter sp.]|nr:transcriptional regulator [Ramlibacter sp.]
MKHILVTPLQVGQLLQTARKAAGQSQAQLAARLGLSQSRLSKLEQNPGSLTLDQLLALCGALALEMSVQERGAPGAAAAATEW